MEQVRSLRNDPSRHYNCAQALLVAFSDEVGLTKERADQLGMGFGSGMMHGSTCGTITAALMIMGMKGYSRQEAAEMLSGFRARHQEVNCAALLAKARDEGIDRKQHCDGLVYEMTAYLDQLDR